MNNDFRSQFPILKRKINNETCVCLDGPAGTHVPDSVIRAISQYYKRSNSNVHGAFTFTQETDKMMSDTRSAVADFLGAPSLNSISFGQNMTTLNFSLARAIGRHFQKGDEIVITQLDHESNRGPWLELRHLGIAIREVRITKDGHLNYDDFKEKINDRTRLVCMGYAANLTGTINNVSLIGKLTYEVGAWLLVDAVHYAPHFRIDVTSLGCDFLLCSAYKFYGPHVGLLYVKKGILDRLPTDRLRTAYQHAPYSIETGTLNHAAISGVKAAIEFIAAQGNGGNLSSKIDDAFISISNHEKKIGQMLYNGLNSMNNIEIIGPHYDTNQRSPTISFVHSEYSANEICQKLAEVNICAWSGHFYAIKATEVLGLEEQGGVTRMGISAYTNEDDIDRTLDFMKKL